MNYYEYLFKLYGWTVDTIDADTASYIAYNETFCIPFSLYTLYDDIYADLGVYYINDKDKIVNYWTSRNAGRSSILKEPIGSMCFQLHGFSENKTVDFTPFRFYGVHHEYHHSQLQKALHGLNSLTT